jgi:hypothetical protein
MDKRRSRAVELSRLSQVDLPRSITWCVGIQAPRALKEGDILNVDVT